jgi:hypothetical protein
VPHITVSQNLTPPPTTPGALTYAKALHQVLKNLLNYSCIHEQFRQISKMHLENVSAAGETFHEFSRDCTGTLYSLLQAYKGKGTKKGKDIPVLNYISTMP